MAFRVSVARRCLLRLQRLLRLRVQALAVIVVQEVVLAVLDWFVVMVITVRRLLTVGIVFVRLVSRALTARVIVVVVAVLLVEAGVRGRHAANLAAAGHKQELVIIRFLLAAALVV